jgi:hypothetical protein
MPILAIEQQSSRRPNEQLSPREAIMSHRYALRSGAGRSAATAAMRRVCCCHASFIFCYSQLLLEQFGVRRPVWSRFKLYYYWPPAN